jgi:hypothetical protein
MKTLDQYLSEVVSPFDEVDGNQEDLLKRQYLSYQRDSLLNSIGSKQSRIEFDMHLDELLSSLEPEGYQLFLLDCLDKLTSIYNLDVLKDYIDREGLIQKNREDILVLVKFFTYNEWIYNLAFCLPEIDFKTISDKQKILDLITAQYLDIQNKIINKDDINSLVRFYFNNCDVTSGIKTLFKLIMSDLPGVISVQLIKK